MKTNSIRDVLNLGFLNRCETLVISGSIDSDMNALAGALGVKAEGEGASVATIDCAMLNEEIADDAKGGLRVVELARFAKAKLLLLQNFGVKKLPPQQIRVIAQLVTERINRTSTIITTVHPLGEWPALIGASPDGASLLRALSIHARQVVIGSREQTQKRKPAPLRLTVRAHV
jgi:DNA replication protein DnaC